ncbi:hypothetical protein MNBD_NITROSPINAE02-834 [hydrothermal vent metagenome]|uniref:Response regulatory domain-containing protein n=1 Tax=hydrothermal vent metagenome TaxID=652676 RepID=A0A3B1C7Q4_9ZZZZ
MAHDLSETKILIIDTQAEIRNMREALREAGFNSLSDISSGLKALTEIKKAIPQVMIVNYNLPQYSGLQIFKSMQADRTLAAIKFIMVIPKMNKKEMAEMMKQGVKNWVERPFGTDDLRESIFKVFGMGIADLKIAGDEIKKDAYQYFENKEFEEALKKFRESGEAYVCAECYFMVGRCYIELGMYDQAIASFQNTMKEDRRYPEIDKWMGIALQKKKDSQGELATLERAAADKDAKANAHVDLGKGYLSAEMNDKADNAFATATKMEPGNVENRKNIGNAYLEKGLYEKAESAFGAAIGVNPEDIALYNRMAIALRKQEKYKEAINIYIKAIRVAPRDEGLFYNLARALFESGDKAKAIKALDKAIALDTEFAEAIALKKEYLAE